MERRKPFFAVSVDALNAVTQVYDFIWPTAVALWNLRWMVSGYHAVMAPASVEDLQARFIAGSGVHGANLHRACLEAKWTNQTGELGRVSLINLFAIYESWAADLVSLVAPAKSTSVSSPAPSCVTCHRPLPAPNAAPPTKRTLEKWLQFPSGSKSGKAIGVSASLAYLRSNEDSAMLHEVRAVLLKRRGVHAAQLDDMLVVYRYFKECRNALMHGGGLATVDVVSATTALAKVSQKKLDFDVPTHRPVALGDAVDLTLYDVVGFGEVLQRIIVTVDAELSATRAARGELERRWTAKHGRPLLKADKKAREGQVRRMLHHLGLPELPQVSRLEASLKAAGLALF